MPSQIESKCAQKAEAAEYAIIGAGPAAICAVASLLKNGVSSNDIIWIDQQFKGGDFWTILSVGSSVPGNTSVESYQKVNAEIYKTIPECAPKKHQIFEIDNLRPNFVCSLKTAAEPLQHITDRLRKIVPSIEGKVLSIFIVKEDLRLAIKLSDGISMSIMAKRIILATGARAKTLKLPSIHNEIVMIDLNIVFIQTELAEYLRKNPSVTTVAVIGSSHSAALATMHLLKAGLTVKQFMDKEYKYAAPCIAADGTKYTKYDNTGLKGDVAKFTKQLLDDINSGKGEYKGKLRLYIGKDCQETNCLLEKHLFGCSHAVSAIGYESSPTLQINNMPLSRFSHNNKTTGFNGVKGLFGIGTAFPQEVKAISGEIESAVGIGKFWATVNNPGVIEIWKKNPVVNVNSPETIRQLPELSCNSRFLKLATVREQQDSVPLETTFKIQSRL